MKSQRTKLAFTLIELLVVITIIGILATGAVSIYTSQIQKARDTTRINDVLALKAGVEQYYQDTFVYPSGASDWKASAVSDVQDYLPNLAEDPKHDQSCNASRCGYVYTVGIDSVGILDGAYELSTAFENEGNRTNKAIDSADSGNDENRLEVGLLLNTFDTSSVQGTAFDGADADDNDATLVIVNSNVVKK